MSQPARPPSLGRLQELPSPAREAQAEGRGPQGPLEPPPLSSPGDDGSGSGSGEGCPDEVCGRKVGRKSASSRTPLTHALPGLSEREGQQTSAAARPLPHTSPLLLLGLALALPAAAPRGR